jgi:hypothetical protein
MSAPSPPRSAEPHETDVTTTETHAAHRRRHPGLLSLLATAGPTPTTTSPAVPLLPARCPGMRSCHIAYPPGLLPAASWQRLMANLPRTSAPTPRWIAASAGNHRLAGCSTPARQERCGASRPRRRRTASAAAAWFMREHREVGASTWALPAVKSAANCAPATPGAEQGDFSERNIRIPR